MADYRKGLHLIPDHMQGAIATWIELAQPAPEFLGSFLRAVLLGKLFEAFGHADAENTASMKQWVVFLYNYAPSCCYGSAERLDSWHECGGLVGMSTREVSP